eukprot:jgi/Chrzof1/9228/Cz03g40200.t1
MLRQACRVLNRCCLTCSGVVLRSCSSAGSAPGDTYYGVPYVYQSDQQVGQLRALGRLESAFETALLSNTVVRERLVERYGFTVHQIRLSKDRRKAYILWDCFPERVAACEKELHSQAYRLKRDIAKNTQSRFTPYLEFRHDHLPANKADVAATIERVERQLCAGDTEVDLSIEAAVQSLSQRLAPRPVYHKDRKKQNSIDPDVGN